jgi:hypothetical protein
MAQQRTVRQAVRVPIRGGAALAKLQEGTYGTGGEVIDKTFWDTLVLASATTVYRMFTVPNGQAGKTLDLTNMISTGQISQGQNHTVNSIFVEYIAKAQRAAADLVKIYSVLNHTTVEIEIPGKDNLGDWTLAQIMGAAFVVPFAAAATINQPMIQPQFNGVLHLKVPIVLSALTSFAVKVVPQVATDAALDGDFIRIGLRGILKRSS